MLVHSLASKYARFVVIVRQIYWTPPSDYWTPPLLKSDDLFLGNQEILDPPPFKNPGHAPEYVHTVSSENAGLPAAFELGLQFCILQAQHCRLSYKH